MCLEGEFASFSSTSSDFVPMYLDREDTIRNTIDGEDLLASYHTIVVTA